MGGQQLFTSLIEQGETAEQTMKITEQAITSTGGASGVTAEEVNKLALSMSTKNGVDKLAIQQSDNLLLRFSNIKNAAGENNDIFDRATQASLDLTAGLHKGQVTAEGLSTTTRLLGKALDDPTKAAGVLRRSGIDLTTQQQDQIKTFMKSNDVLDAQKVILDQVAKTYGGTAAAAATPTQRLKVAVTDLEQELGKRLLPAVDGLVEGLVKAIDWMTGNSAAARELRTVFNILGTTLGAVLKILGELGKFMLSNNAAAKVLRDVILALVGAFLLYQATVKSIEIATVAYTAVTKALTIATDAQRVAQIALDAVMALNPYALIVIAVAALVIGLIELYKHSQAFRDIVHDTWEFIQGTVIGAAHLLVGALHLLSGAAGGVETAWRAMWTVLETVTKIAMALVTTEIKVALAVVQAVFKAGAAILTTIWRVEWDLMAAVVKTFAALVLAVIRVLVDTIRGVLKIGLELVTGQWGAAWHTMLGTARAVTGDITGFIRSAGSAWTSAFGQAGNAIKSGWQATWNALASLARSGEAAVGAASHDMLAAWNRTWAAMSAGARSGWSGIKSVTGEMTRVFTGLPNMFGRVVSGIASVWHGIQAAIHDPIAWVINNPVSGMIKVFNTVGGSVHLPRIPDVHMAAAGMRITEGTTPTADDVLVRVSRDETIVSAAHSRILAPVLAAVGVPGYRAGGVPLPGFQLGGIVRGIGRAAGDVLSATEQAAADAAKAAASAASAAYNGVVNGVVYVADKAIDAGQIAADLAVSKLDSLVSGFESLASMAAPGATGWVKDATGGLVHTMASASVGHLKGFAGAAAKILDSGGLLYPGQYGYNGTGQAELVIPGYAAGGLLGGLPKLAGMTVTAGGQAYQMPTLADLKAMSASNAGMTAQLTRIGQLLEANPQAIANAIAQALNGVARLATAGASYATR